MESPARQQQALSLGQQLFQGIWGMRVVHHHPEGLATVHAIQPSRRAGEPGQGRQQLLQGKARLGDGGEGGQKVVDIEPAQERALDIPFALGRAQMELCSGGTELERRHSIIGILVDAKTAEVRRARPFLQEPAAKGIVSVHQGVCRLEEEAALGLEVGFHIPVVVQVILGEVREDPDFEHGAMDSRQAERMATRLDSQSDIAGIHALA
jgi:hypothetical protein